MLHPRCFTAEWLRTRASDLRVRDAMTFEKCVLALELVARMRQAGLDFVFKGGTSMVLLLEPMRRLSIDVDILSAEPLERISEVLGTATRERPPFQSWQHQELRDREAPPTRHFRAYYASALEPAPRLPHFIQIDVITGDSPYAALDLSQMRASFLEIEEDVEVALPSASSLLGDKLATFAPSTIGYPYQPIIAATGEPGEPRPIKVVKHLFDVGELAPLASNFGETIETYHRIHEQQLRYRGGSWTLDETLNDTQDAAFWVSRIDGRPPEENDKTAFFRQGIRALDSHLFDRPFRFAEARLAAGRAALVAEILRREVRDFNLPAFFATEPDIAALRDAALDGSWGNLNRLRQTDPKAFECWYQARNLT